MLSSFRDRPFRPDAFSDRPLSFFSRPIQEDLANITAIDLIENDDRVARENWQNRQLTNLLRHAQARSKFWRQRMPSRILNHDAKKYLPVLAREDVAKQVELEGSLATTDGAAPMTYSVGGRQYVVIACGGGAKPGSPMGDAYVAFALPSTKPVAGAATDGSK